MGRTLRKALALRLPRRRVAFNPARIDTGVVLTLGRTKATVGSPANSHSAAYGTPVRPGQIIRFTIGQASPVSASPQIGLGTASAALTAQLGATGSAGVRANGGADAEFWAGGVSLGSAGIGPLATGNVLDMELSASQVRYRKNSGSWGGWFTHGLTGTIYLGAALRTATGDNVTVSKV